MHLVNRQGAIIGPGSEWFWSMLQVIIVSGSLIGLYRQLRLQAGAAAIEQVNRMAIEWASERRTRYKFDTLVALRNATDPSNVGPGAPNAIGAASAERREELYRIVVQRVVVRNRQLEAIDWTPAASPFFERRRECPQGDSGTRPLSFEDSLAWYVA